MKSPGGPVHSDGPVCDGVPPLRIGSYELCRYRPDTNWPTPHIVAAGYRLARQGYQYRSFAVGQFPVFARSAGRCCHRSEEHTSELQSLMRISYAVFCLNKNTREPHSTSTKTTPDSNVRTHENN